MTLPPTVFANAHFVAVEKPAGWLSVPSRLGATDARPCLGRRLEEHLNCRIWPVHRLDCEVSGLILYAKTADAHRAACAWFSGSAIAKTYAAHSDGALDAPAVQEALADAVLWRSRQARGKKRAYLSDHGKEALTRARCLGTVTAFDGTALLWQLNPVTGRPHQLRFDLARHGCPILGDHLYGSTRPWHEGIALCCVALDFRACAQAEAFGLPDVLALTSAPIAVR